ncbi:hypothetical protein MES4922_350053 [Mesorhizobium ventifaucium]|uniref:Oligopeptide/dipeptide ABC transporter C-terminal domain-containing protein n=1 Tax=Mesorhizobium ventifaucium TaxID=666020 RepID=A0ABM9E549_9HYPH|nr:hypothetical protein MES4922_350053 [Mesorhizobium ventifaucium]
MIAGLEKITAGDLLIDGVRANEIDPSERGLAMVFQSDALYPHMTVAESMGFALKNRRRFRRRKGAQGARGSRGAVAFASTRPAAEGAAGRPAPACRYRPRHRAQSQSVPVR